MDSSNLDTGFNGEQIAKNYLINQLHYELLNQNWRHKNNCEIDIIMMTPNNELVAIEVRTHLKPQQYQPFESIDHQKINRIKNGLQIYADKYGQSNKSLRVDVVSVIISNQELEHFMGVDITIE